VTKSLLLLGICNLIKLKKNLAGDGGLRNEKDGNQIIFRGSLFCPNTGWSIVRRKAKYL